MFERFTDRARKIMSLANVVAGRFSHTRIESEHVLWGLLKDGSGVGASTLQSLGINLNTLAAEIYDGFIPGSGAAEPPGSAAKSPEAQRVIEAAISESRRLNHNYAGSEHLLLGILSTPDSSACKILRARGVELESARQTVIDILGTVPKKMNQIEMKTHMIDKFKHLLSGIDEELLRLERVQTEAIEAHDYVRAAEIRDRRELAIEQLSDFTQKLSLLLEQLQRSHKEESQ